MQKKLISVLIGAALSATSGLTLAQDGHAYIGANLGYMSWDDDRFRNIGNSDREDGLLGGINLGYQYSSDTAFEFSANADIQGPSGELYSLSVLNFLGDPEDGALYWVVGASYVTTDTRTTVLDNSFSAHIGLGISDYITDKLELRGDFRFYEALDSKTSEPLNGRKEDVADWTLGLTLNYHFGKSSSAPVAAPARRSAPVAAPAPRPAPAPAQPVYETKSYSVQVTVSFASNQSAAVSYGSEVDEIANAMRENTDLNLVLAGHTDSGGAAEYNQTLSQSRAETVKAKLVNDYGIAASRIQARGFGETQPIANNETAAGRAENRRVVGELSWQEEVRVD